MEIQHLERLWTMTAVFNHAISETFLERLQSRHRVVVGGPTYSKIPLVVALRGEYLNVYWRGQSLFNARPNGSDMKVTTHAKYLVDPALGNQVPLVEGAFDVEGLLGRAFTKVYRPGALGRMKKTAGLFSGPEKTGCHEIAVRNSAIIDVEIAFPGKVAVDDDTEKTAPRVDFASVERVGDHEARLIIWEAKDYTNPRTPCSW